MELDLEVAYLRKLKKTVLKFESHLRIAERVVPALPFEAWISWLLSGLRSSEVYIDPIPPKEVCIRVLV